MAEYFDIITTEINEIERQEFDEELIAQEKLKNKGDTPNKNGITVNEYFDIKCPPDKIMKFKIIVYAHSIEDA